MLLFQSWFTSFALLVSLEKPLCCEPSPSNSYHRLVPSNCSPRFPSVFYKLLSVHGFLRTQLQTVFSANDNWHQPFLFPQTCRLGMQIHFCLRLFINSRPEYGTQPFKLFPTHVRPLVALVWLHQDQVSFRNSWSETVKQPSTKVSVQDKRFTTYKAILPSLLHLYSNCKYGTKMLYHNLH
jgi:hypothetical protein